jgi:hypothetical protein
VSAKVPTSSTFSTEKAGGHPVRVEDPETHRAYVVIEEDLHRAQVLFDERTRFAGVQVPIPEVYRTKNAC